MGLTLSVRKLSGKVSLALKGGRRCDKPNGHIISGTASADDVTARRVDEVVASLTRATNDGEGMLLIMISDDA